MEHISRRTLLGRAGLGTAVLAAGTWSARGAGALVTADSAPGTTPDTLPQTEAAATLGAGSFSLFSQTNLNFQTLFALGSSGQTAEAGEVVAAVAQANAAPGGATYQSVYDAFVAMGNRLETAAVKARKAGHHVTARAKFLRASKYYTEALYWVPGTATPDAEAATYRATNDAFTAGIELLDVEPEQLEIPYERRTLPGWFLRPAKSTKPRPTIIMNNGSDGQNVDMLTEGGFAALARGYNVVIFEGPGQGSQLFLENIPFRPDWEHVITPIVDVLETRDDVDSEKIALRGISFGGELTPRAAAFEHRIAALVADPGSMSAWENYPSFIRDISKTGTPEQINATWNDVIVAGSTPEEAFNLKKTLEIFSPEAHDQVERGEVPTDWASLSSIIPKYNLFDVVDKITTPTLVTQYEGDTFFTTEGRRLYDELTVRKKDFVEFTAVDGAQYHCGPMAPQVVNETCWDWLDEQFDR
jgi:pimeloyl-ACP methyl ester carboxylesterase